MTQGKGWAQPTWLLLAGDDVPERWRERATAATLVPLLPHEADVLLAGRQPVPEIAAEDEAIARLVARGAAPAAIATELRLSERTVHRRLARLRRRLGMQSTEDLAEHLRRSGFT